EPQEAGRADQGGSAGLSPALPARSLLRPHRLAHALHPDPAERCGMHLDSLQKVRSAPLGGMGGRSAAAEEGGASAGSVVPVRDLQQQIISDLNVSASIDPASEIGRRVDFLADYL